MNRVFKALADPSRRRILQLLRDGPLSAGDIASHFDLAKPTLSGHFAVLREADLVDQERQGTTIYYRLKLSVLEEALSGLMDSMGIGQAEPRDAPAGNMSRQGK
ncbi:autorepressor SdpR family transcription factor [Nitrospirillum sp. BR 11164]|uniref:autorepressor SdpR family transcription factor n=1 Tax=Nitrospirillum sp. BR 11164 TaxID=3104324 RepID=UPI002AFDF7AA|nr:autorepressor SdpR family transcription factor [Nitrospirillum sp. BR 11164]MEA1650518.1 autorepressor SdpR family transcription factor [Nitrospirillum sp. BR 11164]